MAKCNYFGLKDDPNTALDFASYGNYCHNASPAASPNTAHQKAFCLSENHKSCPVFRLVEKRPLPKDVAVVDNKLNLRENFSYRILGGVFILLTIGLLGAWVILGNSSAAIAVPEGTIYVQTKSLFGDGNNDSLSPGGPSATMNLTRAACTPPDGSVPYTVVLNDSIFQISLAFEVKVVDLLSANCMNEDSDILAGETLYIPPLRTSTPTRAPYVSPTKTVGITPYLSPTSTREFQAKPPTPRPQPTNSPVPAPTDVPEEPTPTSPPPPPTSPPDPPTEQPTSEPPPTSLAP
jgi:LysM repeat protein